jgi:hypothetical protein
MDSGKNHTDQRHHNQNNIQKAEDGLAVILLQLKKAERHDQQENGVCDHHFAAEYIV